MFFVCKQKTAYEMRISDWSSDVCSSDLRDLGVFERTLHGVGGGEHALVLATGQQPADDRNVSEHAVDRIGGHQRTAQIGSIAVQVDRALDRDAERRTVSSGFDQFEQPVPIAEDRKSPRLNSSHSCAPRMPSSA